MRMVIVQDSVPLRPIHNLLNRLKTLRAGGMILQALVKGLDPGVVVRRVRPGIYQGHKPLVPQVRLGHSAFHLASVVAQYPQLPRVYAFGEERGVPEVHDVLLIEAPDVNSVF